MTDPALCPERIYSGRSPVGRDCGKPVKRLGLCGQHAAAKERRAAKSAAREEAWNASDNAKASAEAALAELGIDGRPHYDSIASRYTGQVVVSVYTLRALAEKGSQA